VLLIGSKFVIFRRFGKIDWHSTAFRKAELVIELSFCITAFRSLFQVEETLRSFYAKEQRGNKWSRGRIGIEKVEDRPKLSVKNI